MRKFVATSIVCFILIPSFGQPQRKASIYLQGQFSQTIYDRAKANNPWGMGLGLQVFFNNTEKLKPTIDATADAYLQDDKVLRINSDGTPVNDIRSLVNLFAGASYQCSDRVYISLVTGPSFVSGETLLGAKPSLGFYFSPERKWTGKISFINVFNRDKKIKDDFGSVSFSLGWKLF